MKAIFIDIDGCLNHQHDKGDWTQEERFGLAPDLVANLQTALDTVPDAQLVISSSWRYYHDNMGIGDIQGDWHDWLAQKLGVPRERIEDAPTLHEFSSAGFGAKGRAHDILLWLSEHGEGDPYVVIDDECKEMNKWLRGHVVDCSDGGFTAERADEAVRIMRTGCTVQASGDGGCPGGC